MSLYLETAEFGPQMWNPFAEWVSTTDPEDVSVMYCNDDLTAYRLTPRSVQLWEQRTREYAEIGPAQTGPAVSAPYDYDPNADYVGRVIDPFTPANVAATTLYRTPKSAG